MRSINTLKSTIILTRTLQHRRRCPTSEVSATRSPNRKSPNTNARPFISKQLSNLSALVNHYFHWLHFPFAVHTATAHLLHRLLGLTAGPRDREPLICKALAFSTTIMKGLGRMVYILCPTSRWASAPPQ
jgi:hypothetical protein